MPTSLNGTVGNANNPNNQNDQVSFIVSEVSYAYTPNLGYTISGTVNLADTIGCFRAVRPTAPPTRAVLRTMTSNTRLDDDVYLHPTFATKDLLAPRAAALG